MFLIYTDEGPAQDESACSQESSQTLYEQPGKETCFGLVTTVERSLGTALTGASDPTGLVGTLAEAELDPHNR